MGAIRLSPMPDGFCWGALQGEKCTLHSSGACFSLEDHMPAKKLPWNTIITSEGDWGRLNREELQRVILEVKAMGEAQARAKKRAAKQRGAAKR